ncbi:hypothetical protein ASD45_00945 [Pseudolabrys sp. Root1462]|jgi:hypothetical protein|uniref:hypothetical protein n=1 Tax=Pseudolabrys sp. Root1462 TaxID=1736466 RepID=UPI000702E742|nr:hypothetical protein [Pseudolabrys sp. Root1462]KQY99522.1 hypothetical protein ASD45_00945 [Pseudolabrys sp. Root1462]
MTKTKIALAALLALGFANTAFASDSGLDEFGQVPQAIQNQETNGLNAYAYAPARVRANVSGYSKAERREFNRVPFAEESSR